MLTICNKFSYKTIPSVTIIDFVLRRNFNPEEEKYFNNLEQPAGNSVFVAKLLKENGRYVPRLRGRPRKRIVA